MKPFDTLILYVDDVARSAPFYQALFGVPIVEQSANFAMLALPGTMLGLWARHDVSPAAAPGASGLELCVSLETDADTDAALASARALGVPVVQQPTRLDFGYTFVLQGPDGHRIRVFSAPKAPLPAGQ